MQCRNEFAKITNSQRTLRNDIVKIAKPQMQCRNEFARITNSQRTLRNDIVKSENRRCSAEMGLQELQTRSVHYKMTL
jgi:hypothetical protein